MPFRLNHLTFWARRCIKPVLDAVLPPRCPVTGALVGESGTISPEFWAQLTFLHRPFCARCGTPFSTVLHDMAEEMLCGSCLKTPPLYARARAALKYDDASSGMILAFKHGDKTHLARHFTTWMHQAGTEFFSDTDYLVPVPLHRWRLLKRRYNQAAILCHALKEKTGIPVLSHGVRRLRATESQGQKTKLQRAENMARAFGVPATDAAKIAGKNILLIDDVLTSGATVNECAKALLAAGAHRVDVLTLARVVFSE